MGCIVLCRSEQSFLQTNSIAEISAVTNKVLGGTYHKLSLTNFRNFSIFDMKLE